MVANRYSTSVHSLPKVKYFLMSSLAFLLAHQPFHAIEFEVWKHQCLG